MTHLMTYSLFERVCDYSLTFYIFTKTLHFRERFYFQNAAGSDNTANTSEIFTNSLYNYYYNFITTACFIMEFRNEQTERHSTSIKPV